MMTQVPKFILAIRLMSVKALTASMDKWIPRTDKIILMYGQKVKHKSEITESMQTKSKTV